MTQKAVKVGTNVGYLVVGGAVGYTALLAILAAVIIGLGQLISMVTEWYFITTVWISAALVGIVVGIVAYVLITGALAKLKTIDLTPKETVDTLKEDAQWLKNQVS
jgi:hypothetical protein